MFLLISGALISTKRERIKKIIFTKTIILGCFYRYLAFISTPEMELRHFAQNEIIATEDYIDNSDEYHPERIAYHAQATFYDNFMQTGKLIIKWVTVGVTSSSLLCE